jgi:hypothetical protein
MMPRVENRAPLCEHHSSQYCVVQRQLSGTSQCVVSKGRFFSVLGDIGYDGPVCLEVEDRAYEGSLARRRAALRQGRQFLSQFFVSEEGVSL